VKHCGADARYLRDDIYWDESIILYAVALDKEELDKYWEYICAGGDPKKFKWATPDRAGQRPVGVDWDKITASMGGSMKGDIAHAAHVGGLRRVEKRVWDDSGNTTYHDAETGEQVYPDRDSRVFMRSKVLEQEHAAA
jgi:hypothetical protein